MCLIVCIPTSWQRQLQWKFRWFSQTFGDLSFTNFKQTDSTRHWSPWLCPFLNLVSLIIPEASIAISHVPVIEWLETRKYFGRGRCRHRRGFARESWEQWQWPPLSSWNRAWFWIPPSSIFLLLTSQSQETVEVQTRSFNPNYHPPNLPLAIVSPRSPRTACTAAFLRRPTYFCVGLRRSMYRAQKWTLTLLHACWEVMGNRQISQWYYCFQHGAFAQGRKCTKTHVISTWRTT
jgi:hypothetical protein